MRRSTTRVVGNFLEISGFCELPRRDLIATLRHVGLLRPPRFEAQLTFNWQPLSWTSIPLRSGRSSRQRLGRTERFDDPELQDGRPEHDDGSVYQFNGTLDGSAVQDCAVLAAQVLERRTLGTDRDPRVMPRNPSIIDENCCVS
jgi:hypothetical protein